jgi:hypothetical protein
MRAPVRLQNCKVTFYQQNAGCFLLGFYKLTPSNALQAFQNLNYGSSQVQRHPNLAPMKLCHREFTITQHFYPPPRSV